MKQLHSLIDDQPKSIKRFWKNCSQQVFITLLHMMSQILWVYLNYTEMWKRREFFTGFETPTLPKERKKRKKSMQEIRELSLGSLCTSSTVGKLYIVCICFSINFTIFLINSYLGPLLTSNE